MLAFYRAQRGGPHGIIMRHRPIRPLLKYDMIESLALPTTSKPCLISAHNPLIFLAFIPEAYWASKRKEFIHAQGLLTLWHFNGCAQRR
ncbi:hypothetical protein [Bordetella sp. FB-8]|uniref:hypothetical protein n=1 Tax=Bordetella sp. FB-8 TaxID=1159870 RepID=UPI0012DF241F|nr:hypothetical protein [Bordetella sp. FB-8]